MTVPPGGGGFCVNFMWLLQSMGAEYLVSLNLWSPHLTGFSSMCIIMVWNRHQLLKSFLLDTTPKPFGFSLDVNQVSSVVAKCLSCVGILSQAYGYYRYYQKLADSQENLSESLPSDTQSTRDYSKKPCPFNIQVFLNEVPAGAGCTRPKAKCILLLPAPSWEILVYWTGMVSCFYTTDVIPILWA